MSNLTKLSFILAQSSIFFIIILTTSPCNAQFKNNSSSTPSYDSKTGALKNGQYKETYNTQYYSFYGEGTYKNGLREGNWIYFYDNRNLREKAAYSKGLKLHSETFHKTGEPWGKHTYTNGLKHGEYKLLKTNGKIGDIENYKNGKRHGEQKSFYSDGTLEYIQNFKDGEFHGEQKSYFEPDVLAFYERYTDGLKIEYRRYESYNKILHKEYYKPNKRFLAESWIRDNNNIITYTYYHYTGAIKETGMGIGKTKIKNWYEYDKNGNPTKATAYEAGKIIAVKEYRTTGYSQLTKYYNNGNKKEIAQYKETSELPIKISGSFYPENGGKFTASGPYKNNKKEGKWTINKNGKYITRHYKNGIDITFEKAVEEDTQDGIYKARRRGNCLEGNCHDKYSVLKLSNGIYKGEFKDGKYNGRGIAEYSDGNITDGYFKNNEFVGGKIYKNGKLEFSGTVQKNAYNEITYKEGTRYYSNNVQYKGSFNLKGQPHGYGIQKKNGKIIYAGNWRNGKKVDQKKEKTSSNGKNLLNSKVYKQMNY